MCPQYTARPAKGHSPHHIIIVLLLYCSCCPDITYYYVIYHNIIQSVSVTSTGSFEICFAMNIHYSDLYCTYSQAVSGFREKLKSIFGQKLGFRCVSAETRIVSYLLLLTISQTTDSSVLQYYHVLAIIVLAVIHVHKNRVSRRNKTVSRPRLDHSIHKY